LPGCEAELPESAEQRHTDGQQVKTCRPPHFGGRGGGPENCYRAEGEGNNGPGEHRLP
jgi:hypothetical protein